MNFVMDLWLSINLSFFFKGFTFQENQSLGEGLADTVEVHSYIVAFVLVGKFRNRSCDGTNLVGGIKHIRLESIDFMGQAGLEAVALLTVKVGHADVGVAENHPAFDMYRDSRLSGGESGFQLAAKKKTFDIHLFSQILIRIALVAGTVNLSGFGNDNVLLVVFDLQNENRPFGISYMLVDQFKDVLVISC